MEANALTFPCPCRMGAALALPTASGEGPNTRGGRGGWEQSTAQSQYPPRCRRFLHAAAIDHSTDAAEKNRHKPFIIATFPILPICLAEERLDHILCQIEMLLFSRNSSITRCYDGATPNQVCMCRHVMYCMHRTILKYDYEPVDHRK